jgi:transcription-repair coupling factor (superfamily II helicase)
MFASQKLYLGLTVNSDKIIQQFGDYGYSFRDAVSQEGDFSRRGNIIDIFPFTFQLPVRIELDLDKVCAIRTFDPNSGQPLWEHRIVIILPFSKPSSKQKKPFSEEFPLDNFIDLKPGDYVVHNQHGIGRFLGFERIKLRDKYRDHLVIEYDLKERLYVPVDSMHLVQKYLAFHFRRRRLYKLGSKEWSRVKERARKGVQKLAWEFLTLQAARSSSAGFSYSADTQWQKEFEQGFVFTETADQLKAMQEVKADMQSSVPMDRLLCGDVGYGKTEVAMRAAFKAVMDGKQVAYLVPTTILAQQHYQNFSLRLKNFPLNLELLCRFRTDGEQKKVVNGLKSGAVDIVIATHRLLSDDVVFKDLGLVIIDEEQRFGVNAKEKLKRIRLTTDVLALTATPIPRTLYMSLMGAKQMSVINTPPQNRLPIQTIMVEYDHDLIRQAILREINRKGQVYFLHNRVEDIDKIRKRLLGILPAKVRLAVVHGQMQPCALEAVMKDFLNGQIDCLVSTTIIESGIDIPNANTIIVNNAHTFGLSDLHQLRGRVGRFDRPAYAYFMVPPAKVLDGRAQKRLKAIRDYTHLGAGFNIAMEDLEIRGAGNLLGVQQHGFIAAVGFDLYCRLLKEAIGAFKEIISNDKIKI